MVPCGVPEVTYDQSEKDPLMTTRCLRPTKNCLSQVSKQPSIRYFSILKAAAHGERCQGLGKIKKDEIGRDRWISRFRPVIKRW